MKYFFSYCLHVFVCVCVSHMEILTQKREIGAYFWPLGAQQWRLFYSCRRQIGAYVKYVEMRHS